MPELKVTVKQERDGSIVYSWEAVGYTDSSCLKDAGKLGDALGETLVTELKAEAEIPAPEAIALSTSTDITTSI